MDFEKDIEELKEVMPFKETTDIGDIIITMLPDIALFGVVTNIEADKLKKGGWWHVTFMLLHIPLETLTWILRTEQMTGKEIFTMEGEFRYFAALDLPTKLIQKEAKPKAKLRIIKKKEK